jgi:hypothetical protein
MDSLTHMHLAVALTDQLAVPREMSIACLFPQIDRTPPTLHRMYAHNVFFLERLTALGLEVLFGYAAPKDLPSRKYERDRFAAERPRFFEYLAGIGARSEASVDSQLMSAAKVCYLSHLYLDTFNQPVQAFAPQSQFCSGQWKLWSAIGEFRHALYVEKKVDGLRAELFRENFLGAPKTHSADALAMAMCLRLCRLGDGKLPDRLATEGLTAMGFAVPAQREAEEAYEKFVAFEAYLSRLHEKYLQPAVPAGAPGEAGAVAPAMGRAGEEQSAFIDAIV